MGTPRPVVAFAWPTEAVDERAETLIPPAANAIPISHTAASPAAERINRLEPVLMLCPIPGFISLPSFVCVSLSCFSLPVGAALLLSHQPVDHRPAVERIAGDGIVRPGGAKRASWIISSRITSASRD
jgi:hypothetical protein